MLLENFSSINILLHGAYFQWPLESTPVTVQIQSVEVMINVYRIL